MSERVLVWLLFERDDAVLFALRKGERPPFAGQLVLPGDEMTAAESAAETVGRAGREEIGVDVTGEEFVDTLYLSEAGQEYAINIFRIVAYTGTPRFRESGPYVDMSWGRRTELNDASLPMPEPLRLLLVR